MFNSLVWISSAVFDEESLSWSDWDRMEKGGWGGGVRADAGAFNFYKRHTGEISGGTKELTSVSVWGGDLLVWSTITGSTI